MPSFRSFRSLLAPISLGLLLSVTACAGKKGDSNAPEGKDKAQMEKEKQEAVQAAKVNQLIALANTNLETGHYMSALQLAEDALADNPNNADAYAVLGAGYWRAGDYDKSTEALRKSLEIDPKNYGAGVALARNLRAASAYDESLSVLEPIVAAEQDGFESKPCEGLTDCEDVAGWCDTAEKVCKAPVALDARMGQLWAHYVTLDTDAGPAVADLMFLSGAAGADEEGAEVKNKVIRGYADYLRAFAGKGDLVTFEGDVGTSDLNLDLYTTLLYSFGMVGGEASQVVFSPIQIESRIDTDLAAAIGVESLGKIELLHGTYEVGLIPEIEFQGMKIKNVPALISDLTDFTGAMTEKPGVILGHQALHRVGSLTADIPAHSLTITTGAPTTISSDAGEVPLLLLDRWMFHVPAAKVGIEGAEHKFWAWLGSYNVSAISITHKAYLKSDHLPRDLEEPEDVERGLKMVYIDHVDFGEADIGGFGGLVHLEEPGAQQLADTRDETGFELGGIINMPLLNQLKLTYSFGEGRVWVEGPAAPAAAD